VAMLYIAGEKEEAGLTWKEVRGICVRAWTGSNNLNELFSGSTHWFWHYVKLIQTTR
jgi:hypothetical protein